MLRNLGDLTAEECAERVAEGYSAASMLEKLVAERRVARVRIAGEERYIAAEDAGLYRDALGVPPPPGLPDSFLEDHPDPMAALLRRYARTHGPFPTAQPARATGSTRRRRCASSSASGDLVRGELLPGGREREWCDADVLRRVRRASLAHLRREVEPAVQSQLARFLPSWQNVDAYRAAGAGPDRLREALVPLQGVALTPKVWEADVLPRRLGAYTPAWLDELCTSGEVVWIGAGALGRSDGRVALYFREDVRLAGPPPVQREARAPRGRGPRRDPRAARRRAELLARPGRRPRLPRRRSSTPRSGTSPGRARSTNDAFAPAAGAAAALGPGAPERRGRRFARRRGGAGAAVQGRWSLTAAAVRERPGGRPAAPRPGRADARALRDRHPRDRARRGRPRRLLDALRRARQPRAAGDRAPRLLRRGPRGRPVRAARRGRAAALAARGGRVAPAARRHRSRQTPTAPSLPWPKLEGGRRPARAPGAHVLLRDGEPVVYVERGGRGILRLADLDGGRAGGGDGSPRRGGRPRARLPKLAIEKLDGEPVIGSGHEEALLAAGFSRGPRRLDRLRLSAGGMQRGRATSTILRGRAADLLTRWPARRSRPRRRTRGAGRRVGRLDGECCARARARGKNLLLDSELMLHSPSGRRLPARVAERR